MFNQHRRNSAAGNTLRRRTWTAALAEYGVGRFALAVGLLLLLGAPGPESVRAARKPLPPRAAASRPAPASNVLIPPYAVYQALIGHAYQGGKPPAHITPGLAPLPRTQVCLSTGAARHLIASASSVPATVDLSRYDPPVGMEGAIFAGPAWATAYTLFGWWADRYNLPDRRFAPMSVYAPVSHEKNRPVDLGSVLSYELQLGVDTLADYHQGPFDFKHGPTTLERASAAYHRIAGYACLYEAGHTSVPAHALVKAVLAQEQPLVLGIPVYPAFLAASPAQPLVGLPARGSKPRGAEAVVAVKYDAAGVWVQNEWGPGWGIDGYAELSWSFVDRYTTSAWVISVKPPVSAPSVPYPTVIPGSSLPPITPQPSIQPGTPAPITSYCVPPSIENMTATVATTSSVPLDTPTPTATGSAATVTPVSCLPDNVFTPGVPISSTPLATLPPDTAAAATAAAATLAAAYLPYSYSYPTTAPLPYSNYISGAPPTQAPSTDGGDQYSSFLTAIASANQYYGNGTAVSYAYPTDLSFAGTATAYAASIQTPMASATAAQTPTASGTATQTPTASAMATQTPTSTATGTPTSTSAPSATASPTSTPLVPFVSITPTSGVAGSAVTLTVSGFGPGPVTITWNGAPLGTIGTDDGSFTWSFTVPADAAPGQATIAGHNTSTGLTAYTSFSVSAPPTTVTLTPMDTPSSTPPPIDTATGTPAPGTTTTNTPASGTTTTNTPAPAITDTPTLGTTTTNTPTPATTDMPTIGSG